MVAVRKVNRALQSTPVTIGAPVGGLNGRDALADMEATDAFVMDNWFPYNTSCDIRKGCLDYVTGLPGPVEGLETYTGPSGYKMLAFSNGGIYDVSVADTLHAALITGRVSNQPVTCMFSNAGISVLQIYTGYDEPLMYDGVTLTPLAITGVSDFRSREAIPSKRQRTRARKVSKPTLISYTGQRFPVPTARDTLPVPSDTGSQIFCGHAFKGRMYLGQTGVLGFYYLGVGAVQGPATFFDLSQQAFLGGSLAAITSISQTDAGVGPADYIIFITTEGEYIMYSGTDPTDPTNWALVARYTSGALLGKLGWFKFRSDVYLVTEEGVMTVSQLRAMGPDINSDSYATAKLGRMYEDLTVYRENAGWCSTYFPDGQALMINMPTSNSMSGDYIQYVMNTNNGAWCRYTGWNALAWTLFNRESFFGTFDGRVVQANYGNDDNGVPITATCRQAWNNFDNRYDRGEMDKLFHFVSFAISSDGTPPISCILNMNYKNTQPLPIGSLPSLPPGAIWDVSFWDEDYWAGTSETQNFTVPVGMLGYVASVWLEVTAPSSNVRWYATRYVFQPTQGILFS